MSEAAEAKLETLITESQAAEDAPKLYPLDAAFIAVSFNARPNAEKPKIVSHKLRRPTLEDLKIREGQTKSELISVNSREDEENTDDWVANINLWNKLIVGVKGYKGAGDDWREISPEEKAAMKPEHKYRAILQVYAGSAVAEYGDDDDVPIGAEMWIIRQEIGLNRDPDFVVRHSLREPNEREREKFKGSSRRISYVRGAKHTRTKISTSLQSYCDLYDALILSIDGATVDGQTFSAASRKAFLAAVDPQWKKKIVEALMGGLGGQSSD